MKPDDFLKMNANKFPALQMGELRAQLSASDSRDTYPVMSTDYRDPYLALILSIFFGVLGVDRFYVGDIGVGFGKLALTILGGVGGVIWWFVDLFLIVNRTRQRNYELAESYLRYARPTTDDHAQAEEQASTMDADEQDDESDFDDF